DEAPADVEPEAEPAEVLRRHGALEAIEDARLPLGIDADALVLDDEERRAAALLDADGDRLARAEPAGADQQGRADLVEARGVPRADDVGRDLERHGAARARGVLLEARDDLAHELAEVDLGAREHDLPGLEARDVEQVVDEAVEALGLARR